MDQGTPGTGNPLIDGVTRAWDLLMQQVDDILGWSPPMGWARTPSSLSDGALRDVLSAAAARLLAAPGPGSAAGQAGAGDPRWRFNLPATAGGHVRALAAEARDTFGFAATGLDEQASPAAVAAAGRLAEILARIRWLTEPADPSGRQERAYALTAEAIDQLRSASEHAEAAAGDGPASLAGEIADRAATMEARLADLVQEDGRAAVRVPRRRKLLRTYLPDTDLDLFGVLAAAGSRPGTVPSALFYVEPGAGDALRGFQRLAVTRAYWLAQAATWYAAIRAAAAAEAGLEDAAAGDDGSGLRDLAAEAARRYRERVGRGLHPGL